MYRETVTLQNHFTRLLRYYGAKPLETQTRRAHLALMAKIRFDLALRKAPGASSRGLRAPGRCRVSSSLKRSSILGLNRLVRYLISGPHPTTAFRRFPPVHSADLEGALRVETAVSAQERCGGPRSRGRARGNLVWDAARDRIKRRLPLGSPAACRHVRSRASGR